LDTEQHIMRPGDVIKISPGEQEEEKERENSPDGKRA
jgi:hypothetical protein